MDDSSLQNNLASHCTNAKNSHKWVTFISMCMAIFVVAFATTATTNAMIPIRAQMHLDPSQLQWTTNAYILAASVLMVLGGLLSDRYGRRNMNLIGGVIFIIGSIVCATSTTAIQFIFGRFIQGVGVAIIMPGTLALMKVVFGEEEQSIVTTGWAVAIGLGMGLGPFLSGVFCETVGWEYLFALIGAIMTTSMILLIIALHHRSPTNQNVTIDYLGLSVFLVGYSMFVYAFTEGTTDGWGSPLIASFLIVGILLMLSQYWVEKHVHKTPFINFQYFKRPRFSLGCIGMFIDGYVLISILFFGNLYIQNPLLLNYSAYQAGLAVIPMGAGLSIAVLFVERLYDRVGIPACLQLAFIFMLAGAVWFICLGIHTSYSMVWESFFLIGLGCGMATKAFPAMGMQALSREEAARSASVVSAFLYVGVIFSTAIGTIISLAVARDWFLHMTAHLTDTLANKLRLEDTLLTAPSKFSALLQTTHLQLQAHYKLAAEVSALRGLHFAMISTIAFLVIAMLATNILLKMKPYHPLKNENL